MFAAVPMVHLRVVVHQRQQVDVLRALGRLGVVQLVLSHSDPGPGIFPQSIPDLTGDLLRWKELKDRAGRLKRSLAGEANTEWQTGNGDALASSMVPEHQIEPVAAATNELEVSSAEQLVSACEARAMPLLHRLDQLRCEEKRLETDAVRVSRYAEVPLPLRELSEFGFLHLWIGQLPRSEIQPLKERLGEACAIWVSASSTVPASLVVATDRAHRSFVESALFEAGFQHERLPTCAGDTPMAVKQHCLEQLRKIAVEREQLAGEIRRTAADLNPSLNRFDEQAEAEIRLLGARQLCGRTEATVSVSGWLPESDRVRVEQVVSETSDGCYSLEVSKAGSVSGKEVPTLLRLPRWLRPFSDLVTIYGLPAYKELVPSLFVALSYPLMFGMMFGDVGHGTLLMLAGWVLAATKPANSAVRPSSFPLRRFVRWTASSGSRIVNAGWLMMSCGFASAVFGWFYGSCFGLHEFKRHALWRDPLEADPIQLMQGAIAVGVVTVSLGLCLNIVNRFRQRDWIGAVLDKFGLAGLLFYWTALSLVVMPVDLRSRFPDWAPWVMLGSSLVAWAAPGFLRSWKTTDTERASGETVTTFVESLVGSFEGVLLYLANTVSFVRLAAYALSHAALLVATFGLAEQLRDSSRFGGPMALLVIVLGNVVTMIIEGIVASVQALRLEYYEFFGKFFAGDGRPFEPFQLLPDVQNQN